METTNKKRKTVEERVAEIDKKIAKHKAEIDSLNQKKESLLNPAKKITYKMVINVLKEQKMSPEEMVEKLGIKF